MNLDWDEISAEDLAELVVGSACWVAVLALVSWSLGLILFRPLYEPSILFRARASFRLSDMVVLAAQLQIAMAITLAVMSHSQSALTLTVAIDFGVLITIWWGTGLYMLAKAGVESNRDRWLFLGLLMPTGYCLILFLSAATVTFPLTVVAMVRSLATGNWQSAIVCLIWIWMVAVAIVVTPLYQISARTMARRARDDRARRDGIQWSASA